MPGRKLQYLLSVLTLSITGLISSFEDDNNFQACSSLETCNKTSTLKPTVSEMLQEFLIKESEELSIFTTNEHSKLLLASKTTEAIPGQSYYSALQPSSSWIGHYSSMYSNEHILHKRDLNNGEKLIVLKGMKKMIDNLKNKDPHLSNEELMRDFVDVMYIDKTKNLSTTSSKKRNKGLPNHHMNRHESKKKKSKRKKGKTSRGKSKFQRTSSMQSHRHQYFYYTDKSHSRGHIVRGNSFRTRTNSSERSHLKQSRSKSDLLTSFVNFTSNFKMRTFNSSHDSNSSITDHSKPQEKVNRTLALDYLKSIAELLTSFRKLTSRKKVEPKVSPSPAGGQQDKSHSTINNVKSGQLVLTPRLQTLPSSVVTKFMQQMLRHHQYRPYISPRDQYKVLAANNVYSRHISSKIKESIQNGTGKLVDEQAEDLNDISSTTKPSVIQQYTGREEAFDWKPTVSTTWRHAHTDISVDKAKVRSETNGVLPQTDEFSRSSPPYSENYLNMKTVAPSVSREFSELIVDSKESSGYVSPKELVPRFPMIKTTRTMSIPIIKSSSQLSRPIKSSTSLVTPDHQKFQNALTGSDGLFHEEEDDDDDDRDGFRNDRRYGPTSADTIVTPTNAVSELETSLTLSTLKTIPIQVVKRNTSRQIRYQSSEMDHTGDHSVNSHPVELLRQSYKPIPSENKYPAEHQDHRVDLPLLQSRTIDRIAGSMANKDGIIEYKTFDNYPVRSILRPNEISVEGDKRTVLSFISKSSDIKPASEENAIHYKPTTRRPSMSFTVSTVKLPRVPTVSIEVSPVNVQPTNLLTTVARKLGRTTKPIPLIKQNVNAADSDNSRYAPEGQSSNSSETESDDDKSSIMDELVEAIKEKEAIIHEEGLKANPPPKSENITSSSKLLKVNKPISSAILKSIFPSHSESQSSVKFVDISAEKASIPNFSPLDALGPPLREWTSVPVQQPLLPTLSTIAQPLESIFPTAPSLVQGTPPPVGISYGRKFFVTIRLLNQIFDNSLYTVGSWRFQKLRDEIQLAILRLYADDDTYAATQVLNFRPSKRVGKIMADLALFFLKTGPHHLLPLEFQLHSGKLGELETSRYIINISRYDGEMAANNWCMNSCWNAFLCYPKCTEHCCAGPHHVTSLIHTPLQTTVHPLTHLITHPPVMPPQVPTYHPPQPPPLPMPYVPPYVPMNPPTAGNFPITNPYFVYNVMITPPNVATQNPVIQNQGLFPRINPAVARQNVNWYVHRFIGRRSTVPYGPRLNYRSVCGVGCPSACSPLCSHVCCLVGRRRRKRQLLVSRRLK